MLKQKIQRPSPRRFIRVLTIAVFGEIEKSMGCVFVRIKFVRLAEPAEFPIELHHVIRGGIRVISAKVALNWTADVGAPFERRRQIAAPCAKQVSRVICDGGLESRMSRGTEESQPPAHAEADDA